MGTRAFDARPDHPVVHTLVKLHADLGGQIQRHKEQGHKLAEQMRAVEAVIRLFDPAYDVRRIAVKRRRRGNPFYRRGECWRAALDALRDAAEPMTVRELCLAMLAKLGVTEPTAAQVRDLYGAVNRSLLGHDGDTVVTVGQGAPRRWALAR